MSRFNPEILERRLSQSPPKRPPVSRNSPLRQPPQRLSLPPSEQSATFTRKRSPTRPSPENAPGDDTAAGSEQDQRESAEPPPRTKGVKTGLAAAPRRSLPRPNPRPLPPPAPDGEADLNPFLGNTLRRSPQTGIAIPPPPEPELPPSVPDAVSSTPPRGIHSSSPSKWRGRNKPPSSSPLKRPPTRPGENDTENVSFFNKNLKKAGVRRGQLGQGGALRERSTNIRGIKPQDANREKKRKRDELAKELQALKRDLDFAERENDRIQVMLRSGRKVTASDEDAVLDLLKRHLAPNAIGSLPSQSELLAKAALDPLALVPMGRPVVAVIPDSEEDEEASDTVHSHRPVIMAAAEELPFLELFSPFSISSEYTTLPRIADEPLRQQFSVRLQARQSPALFSALVKITLDALKLEIVTIDVGGLEPAAKPELDSFLRKICQGECNRSMERNIGIITWAMAEWLRISERRAQFWSKLQQETQSKAAILEVSRDVRAKASRQTKGTGSTKSSEGDELSYATVDLLPFMGLQSFDIKVPSAGSTASVRLNWRVEFDWTGEAQSKVSAVVSIPGSWHGVDRKGAFGKLPSLFQGLVEGGEEPNVAVRKVVALLAGN
uniref:Uncharacterized protein n=1 Tax=Bionectria ochroleuca TaxID=29856 RepID=A0A8H7TNE6_BIOOC